MKNLSRILGVSAMKALTIAGLGLVSALSLSACGTESDTEADARVVDIFLEDSTIDVGDATVVRVDFRFDSSAVLDDGDNVRLVVRLPEGIQFRDGTAELVTLFGDDRIGAQVTNCSLSGESYLLFDMDEFDLDDVADIDGEADARLKLTIDAVARTGVEAIGATANNSQVPFSCGDFFVAEEATAVEAK